MIEFKMDASDSWYELKIHNAWTDEKPSLVGFSIRINDVVYSEITPEFIEAYEANFMWEKLQK